MSAFRFRLERVLGVRRIEEDLARAEWLTAELSARAAEEAAASLQSALARARADLAALQSRSELSPADVALAQELESRLCEQCVQKTIHAGRARRDAEKLFRAMSERRTAVRGLETLESNARRAWRAQKEAFANAELDSRAQLLGARIGIEHEARVEYGTRNQS